MASQPGKESVGIFVKHAYTSAKPRLRREFRVGEEEATVHISLPDRGKLHDLRYNSYLGKRHDGKHRPTWITILSDKRYARLTRLMEE
jgi:hypothetical protein